MFVTKILSPHSLPANYGAVTPSESDTDKAVVLGKPKADLYSYRPRCGKHKIGKDKFFNCLFLVTILWFKRRLSRCIFMRSPFHCMAVTKRNRLIHFKSNLKYDWLRPIWFQGYIEVRSVDSIKRKIFSENKFARPN